MNIEQERCPKRRGRFFNPHIEKDRRTLWDALLWKFGFYDELLEVEPPPIDFRYPGKIQPYVRSLPSAVWIGHSTYLVDCKDWTILTDPVWSQYCAPVPIRSLERLAPVPMAIEALPRIDAVLLSHNHYDHLDVRAVKTLHRLQPHILWCVPKGLSRWFSRRGIDRVIELDWWQSFEKEGHRITAVPAQHFSGRTLWDKDKTLWNGYVLESPRKTVYFVGDTGYNASDFKNIGRRFSSIDLSLIPIGSYVPRPFMSPVHCSPSDGVQIHLDVGSRLSLGMHWKTFCLSDEPIERPPYDLYLAMKEKNLPFDTFLPIDIGVYVNW